MAHKEIAQFERWLKEAYKQLEEMDDAPESVPYRAADLVREASDMARRLGAGHVAVSRLEFYQGGEVCGTNDAKSALGRMLHWCREELQKSELRQDGLLSFKDAAAELGVSEKTLRRLVDNTRRARDGKPVTGPMIEFVQARRGAAVLFDPKAIEAFKARHTHTQPAM